MEHGLGNGWSSASCRDDYRPYNRSVFNSLSESSNLEPVALLLRRRVVQTRAERTERRGGGGPRIISNAPLRSSVILRVILFPLIKSGSSPLLLFPQSNEPGDAHFRLGYDQQRPAPSPPCNLIAATRRSAWPRFGDEMRVRMETKTFPSSSSNENSSFATRWPDRLLARRAVFRRLMHLTSG